MPPTRRPTALIAVLSLVLTLAAAGCGDDAGSGAATTTETTPKRAAAVDLALDFTPNPVHAPIFAAVRTGADRGQGVDLRIRNPGDGPDALKLVEGGRALMGILDIHDLALARERGVDVVAVAALVQRPLAALLADPAVRRPRDLAGRTVGVSGLPSDPAFVRAIVEADGGDYDRIRQVTIGFKAVSALLARRVDAVPAFWNAEGVALEQRGRRLRQFRVEDFGAPVYPEVVLFTSRRTLEARRDDVAATVKAIEAGVEEVLAHPDAAVEQMSKEAGTGDEALVRAQLDAVMPLFSPPMRLNRAVLERWADFDVKAGLVKRRPDVDRAFDLSIAGDDGTP